MQTRTLPISELQPAPYNPRVDLEPGMSGFERLRRSLAEFGLVQPIVWNEKTGHVIGGHQRLVVLKEEGHATVDVVVVSLDEPREKALNVALNNTQVGGDWDADKLLDLMQDLQELPDFDETLTGFDEADIRDLLFAPEPDWQAEAELQENPAVVRVTLEIDKDRWEEIRPEIDAIVRRWKLRAHVKQL